jgi:DNA gyrase inhibitor GyrI
MTVAFASMKGHYSQIGETFGKIYGWIGEKGFVPSGAPIGVYFNAPG